MCSVLSGNRNFEGRIHPEVKMNYLASPPLCVAYALAGRMDIDLAQRAAPGRRAPGRHLARRSARWPTRSSRRSSRTCSGAATARCSRATRTGTRCDVPEGDRYAWDADSTYVKRPPYFDGMDAGARRAASSQITGARAIALLGDSVTTDHISPAGAIEKRLARRALPASSTASSARDFNSYGSRRGNHEVMMRGTFANVRLRNQLAPGTEGGVTVWDGEQTTIYDAAMAAAEQGVPLCVLAGEEYGSGSSRDWAAKGPSLLGDPVRARRSPTSASTARTSSAWACCRSSSPTASRSSRSG